MPQDARFFLTTCQVGAERALKREFARRWPELHAAFSRPGFVTFKHAPASASGAASTGPIASPGTPLDESHADGPRLDEAIFARAWSNVLGRVRVAAADGAAKGAGESDDATHSAEADAAAAASAAATGIAVRAPAANVSAEDMASLVKQVWELAGDRPYRGLHVWHRDTCEAGEHGYEPELLPEDKEIAGLLRAARPDLTLPAWVHSGSMVLDVVVVEPNCWWVGWHTATTPTSSWPGGFAKIVVPEHVVARTYLKMEEGLRFAEFPMRAGQACAEVGSAPGGASQALLARGLLVTGIDPAEMHPLVLAHSNFRHIRKRGHEVRRREFRKTRWLTADMNVPPTYTLDTVEGIVTHPETNVRGLLLTLKLPQWELADQIPEYLFRIRTWGFHQIRARQLQHNRREFTVAAMR